MSIRQTKGKNRLTHRDLSKGGIQRTIRRAFEISALISQPDARAETLQVAASQHKNVEDIPTLVMHTVALELVVRLIMMRHN